MVTVQLVASDDSVEWLAAYGLAVRLEMIIMPIIFGIGGTLIPLCGAHLGAGQYMRAIRIAWTGMGANFLLLGGIGLLLSWQPSLWCEPFGSVGSSTATAGGAEARVIGYCEQAVRIIAPTYAFFAVGLSGYIASQAMNTLALPVSGALLRLLIVGSGLWWVSAETAPTTVLSLIAFAVCCYGPLVAIGLHLGPWATPKSPRPD